MAYSLINFWTSFVVVVIQFIIFSVVYLKTGSVQEAFIFVLGITATAMLIITIVLKQVVNAVGAGLIAAVVEIVAGVTAIVFMVMLAMMNEYPPLGALIFSPLMVIRIGIRVTEVARKQEEKFSLVLRDVALRPIIFWIGMSLFFSF